MQDGAGTNKIGDLFEKIISDSKFDKNRKTIQEKHGITIRSKESLYYFNIFQKFYGVHQTVDDKSKSCPYCHFNTENSKFCRMCGAFPI